jgi:hypothetical protein
LILSFAIEEKLKLEVLNPKLEATSNKVEPVTHLWKRDPKDSFVLIKLVPVCASNSGPILEGVSSKTRVHTSPRITENKRKMIAQKNRSA